MRAARGSTMDESKGCCVRNFIVNGCRAHMKAQMVPACGTPPLPTVFALLRSAFGVTRTHTVLSANVFYPDKRSLSVCASAAELSIVNIFNSK